jgi:hypothetical protein
MPILSNLEFVTSALAVAYRPSPDPQELRITIHTEGPASQESAPQIIRGLIETIRRGGAGGAMFHPALGDAELLAGPWDPPQSLGPDYLYVLRVSAIAPKFFRTMIEALRGAGWDKRVVGMSLVGSLPRDPDALWVDDAMVRPWFDDPDAYLERYPSVPFALDHEEKNTGADLRVELGQNIDPKIREELEILSIRWLNAIKDYVDPEGEQAIWRLDRRFPKIGRGKREFSASYEELAHTRGPAADMLINLLVRFHAKVAPIRRVELQL